jgi:hypothetical protein
MSLRRRSVIVGLGSLVAGLGTVVGSGAFSSVSADRTVSIETTGDSDALLRIEAGDDGSEYVDDTSGTVEVAVEEANDNAVTAVDRLLEVTNNGAEEVTVGFDNEYAINQGDYSEPPGGWGYVANDTESAAAVVWASPFPKSKSKSLSDIRPDLVSTGFDGSTLADGRMDDEVEDKSERTIEAGKSLNVGIVIDTRDSTIEENTVPDALDSTVSLYADAT